MGEPRRELRVVLLVLAVITAAEVFRPAPATMQLSVEKQLRDIAYELRGIRQELSSIERKMK